MGIRDRKMLTTDKSTWKTYQVRINTLVASQTATVFWESVPPFNGVVVAAEFYCTTLTGLTSVDLQIGSHSATTTCLAAAITPTAGTAVQAVMAAIPPAVSTAVKFGPDGNGAGTTLHAVYTSASGSPVVADGLLTIWVRPRPLNGEIF